MCYLKCGLRRGVSGCAFLMGVLFTLSAIAKPNSMEERINRDFQAGNLNGLHTVMVWHKGEIIAANHFIGEDRNWGQSLGKVEHSATTLHDLRSITKSITSLLYGIALAEGKVPNVKSSLVEHFPEYAHLAGDKQRQKITIHHTLSMQMGLEWNERLPYTDPRNSETAMELAQDRHLYALSQLIVEQPGKRWIYNGGSTELIAKLIEKGTGKSLTDYANEKLFKPLGISTFGWTTNKDGGAVAAAGLRLSAQDLIKIGQLILNDGLYAKKQIVSKDWLRQSFARTVDVPFGVHYGYFWYVSPKGAPTQWVAGFGNGGQRLLVDKQNQLIQVVLAGNYNQRDAWKVPDRLLNNFILPEISSSK